ncbi:hypothetical protein M413DRAFT_278282 [Hebeloma cylindrosporum]|uniref:Uncharacterized protein n=1 Tax=Hebeloma cylindrosporum TaxID=76867 RepID=A0A0C3BKA1_HEBCY|nr:hypothetical protein M413DRAFT_278282 [Hebeloma cylindrosporum h7]
MQAAHIINTVRKDDQRKWAVEELLTQQRLQASSYFELDSIINCILLEASYHVQWDVYGTFCIVPAEDDAQAMLAALKTSNQKWIVNEALPRPFRPLNVSLAPFYQPKWDVVVLHPQGFLPDGETLPFAEGRYFHTPTSPPPQNTVTWTYWIPLGDQLVSASNPNIPFPPFTPQDARSRTQTTLPPISSLAMVVNAHAKLQSFMTRHSAEATPRIRMFAKLVSELMDEIFFVPEGYHSPLDKLLTLQVPSQSPPVPGAPSIGAVLGTAIPPALESGQSSASFDPMQELDAPEHPDEDDGLTDSEFRLLAQQACDPKLKPRDRSNAAAMLIGGVHAFANPRVMERLAWV